jgi:hypothetical protein
MFPGPSRGGTDEGEDEETSGSENKTRWRVRKRLAKSKGLLGTRPKKNKIGRQKNGWIDKVWQVWNKKSTAGWNATHAKISEQ